MHEPSDSFLKFSISFFFLSVLLLGDFSWFAGKFLKNPFLTSKKQLVANSPQSFLQSCLNKAEISKAKGKKQPLVVFFEKGVLKDFAKFTRKHLSKIFFLTKLQAWGVQLY